MLSELLSKAGVVGGAIGIFFSVNALFYKMDDFFSKESKDDFALWLLCLEPTKKLRYWPQYFIGLFDVIFRKNRPLDDSQIQEWRYYINLHTLTRSCIASILSVLIVSIIGFTVGPLDVSSIQVFKEEWYIFLTIPLLINLVPDYISLLETRYLLNLAKKNRSVIYLFVLLIADIILTLAIFVVFSIFMGWAFLSGFDGSFFSIFYKIFDVLAQLFWVENDEVGNILGVCAISTYFTSVWIWLFVITNNFVSIASRSDKLLKVAKYMLPIDERPFRSIGIIAGMVSMMLYLVIAALQKLI